MTVIVDAQQFAGSNTATDEPDQLHAWQACPAGAGEVGRRRTTGRPKRLQATLSASSSAVPWNPQPQQQQDHSSSSAAASEQWTGSAAAAAAPSPSTWWNLKKPPAETTPQTGVDPWIKVDPWQVSTTWASPAPAVLVLNSDQGQLDTQQSCKPETQDQLRVAQQSQSSLAIAQRKAPPTESEKRKQHTQDKMVQRPRPSAEVFGSCSAAGDSPRAEGTRSQIQTQTYQDTTGDYKLGKLKKIPGKPL